MRNEFMLAINQVCAERQLAKEVVLEAVETALITAYKRNFGSTAVITARIDPETGAAHVYAEKTVSEEVNDPKIQISLAEALLINPLTQIGETVGVETTPKDFGRIAAQTAKQVILQRIREAERDQLYSQYADREGEIVTGTVQSIDSQVVIVNLGKAEGTLPRSEQIPGERYGLNSRVKAYVMEVDKGTRGPRIILSRSHRNMLRRLLELEVPEIFNGAVEIKAIAREPGSRSKVAVAAIKPGVDPVGSCVGMRGTRIQGIVDELHGEKIDVVEWKPEVTEFISNALSPARVVNVRLDDGLDGKTATVIVPDAQLSLAIGKEGQNARLAAKLTGWRIDIKSASEAAAQVFAAPQPAAQPAAGVEDLLARAEAMLTAQAGEMPPAEQEHVEKVEELAGVAPIEAELEPAMIAVAAEPAVVIEEAAALAVEAAAAEAATEAVEAQAEEVEGAEGAEEGEAAPAEMVVAAAGELLEGETVAAGEVPAAAVLVEGEAGEWVEPVAETEEDAWGVPKKKGKPWRNKKQEIVLDEASGQLVTKRKRKPGRSRDAWGEYEE